MNPKTMTGSAFMEGLFRVTVNVVLLCFLSLIMNLLCFTQSEIKVITLADKCLPLLLPDLLRHSEHDLPIVEALNYNITN